MAAERRVSLFARSEKRRRSLLLLALVVACALVTGGSGLTAAILAPTAGRSVTPGPAACAAPVSSFPEAAASRHGSWGFDLLEPGTFGAVASSSSALYALQACGVEETVLRVLELRAGGKVAAVSPGFPRAALFTSSLAFVDGSLYVGAARLDLTGPAGAAPYLLTVYRLSPSTLRVLGSRQLGRGYGLSLSGAGPAGTTLLASTGRALLELQAVSLTPRRLASFGSLVAQHLAADPGAPYVAVSLFAPGAVPARARGTIELFDVATGRTLSTLALGGGAVVESMTMGEGDLFVTLGSGSSSSLRRLLLPGLGPRGTPPGAATGLAVALQPVAVGVSGGMLWASEPTALACLDVGSGQLLASTAPRSPVVAVAVAGPATYAATEAGVGILAVPASCRRA